jgi:hypothetical protein
VVQDALGLILREFDERFVMSFVTLPAEETKL